MKTLRDYINLIESKGYVPRLGDTVIAHKSSTGSNIGIVKGSEKGKWIVQWDQQRTQMHKDSDLKPVEHEHSFSIGEKVTDGFKNGIVYSLRPDNMYEVYWHTGRYLTHSADELQRS
jgi:hypothetical protein